MARLVAVLLGVALLTAAVAAVLWVLITAAAAYGVFCLALRWWQVCHHLRDVRVHQRAELLARVEIQHRWYITGDSRGTHGRYPPAVGAFR